MKTVVALAGLLATAGCGQAKPVASAPAAATQAPSVEGLALAAVHPRDPGVQIALASPAVGRDGKIADRMSAYHDNLSPALSWRPVAGAASFAIVIEDPDARGPTPFVHWMIWNIPGATTALPEGLPPTPRLAAIGGATQGANGTGKVGYHGPHPPSGVHRYHLEIFALDQPLALPPGADRAALVGAMTGHVLADDDLVGTYAAPAAK